MQFSTMDKDNDDSASHCTVQFYGSGGWWFDRCGYSSLNGINYGDGVSYSGWGLSWYTFANTKESLKTTTMSIIPTSST